MPIPLVAGEPATVAVPYAENGQLQVIPATGALSVSNIAQIAVAFSGPGASIASAVVAEVTDKGYYTIDLLCNLTKALTLNVTISGVHVKGSPFTVKVAPASLKPSATTLTATPVAIGAKARVGLGDADTLAVRYLARTYDVLNNPGGTVTAAQSPYSQTSPPPPPPPPPRARRR